MVKCPICGWDNVEPVEPGDVLCANPSCGATFSWPLPLPPEPEPTPTEILDGLSDQEILLLANELANRLTPIEPPKKAPIITPLVGNGLHHTTDPLAAIVRVKVVSPTGGPERARPTVNGMPVCGGAGDYVYQAPGTLNIKTNAGNNDLVVTEEFV